MPSGLHGDSRPPNATPVLLGRHPRDVRDGWGGSVGWYAAVGVGGVVGATLRWAVATTVGPHELPVATLAVNVVGCLVLGAVVALRTSPASAGLSPTGSACPVAARPDGSAPTLSVSGGPRHSTPAGSAGSPSAGSMRSAGSARAGAGSSSLEPALAGPAEPTSDGSAGSGPVDAVLEGGAPRGATESPTGGSADPEAARSAGPAPAGSAVSAPVGSALSGPVVAGEEADAEVADEATRSAGSAPAVGRRLGLDVVGVGVCGGLTTFSSFTAEVVDRVARGRWPLAVAYVAVSLAGGFGAFLAGEAGVGRWRHRRRSGRGWQEPGAW